MAKVIEGLITVARMEQGSHRDRAAVDHRIERAVGEAVQLDRVEGVAAGFDPHVLMDLLGAEFVHRQAVGKRLGDRLNRKEAVAVACLEDLPSGRHDAQPEGFGAHLAQFGDVGGDVSFGVAAVLFEELVEHGLELVLVLCGLGHQRRRSKVRSGRA